MFVKVGVPKQDAGLVADHLVDSDMFGHNTHGVLRLPQYVDMVREGVVTPGASLRVLKDNDFSSRLCGGWNFGPVSAQLAMDPETELPLGFPKNGFPGPQGPYYTSVGSQNTFGRDLVDEHLHLCLEAGLNVEGINAEVMMGQWEFQIFAKGACSAGDQIWLGRYLLERTAEKYDIVINWHPKPIKGDWNGSGMHANFSNGVMRDAGNEELFTSICEEFGKHIPEHIDVYGADNDQRLTGLHETQSIDKFSYGTSDRGASIRIPIGTVDAGWKGRLEDRRPASNADPYKVAAIIIKTTKKSLS